MCHVAGSCSSCRCRCPRRPVCVRTTRAWRAWRARARARRKAAHWRACGSLQNATHPLLRTGAAVFLLPPPTEVEAGAASRAHRQARGWPRDLFKSRRSAWDGCDHNAGACDSSRGSWRCKRDLLGAKMAAPTGRLRAGKRLAKRLRSQALRIAEREQGRYQGDWLED